MKIYIDAGHNDGGWNTGAVGNGLREQDITFAVAKKLSELLKARGLETKLSRPTKETNLGTNNSTSINARYAMANTWGADLFVSIHCNAGGGTGAETLYYKNDSKAFAQTLQEVYCAETGFRSRGIKYRNDVGVVMYTKMPACLVELGFIDTTADAARLKNEQDLLALAIAKGFYKYLNLKENIPIMKVENKTMIINGSPVAVSNIFQDGSNYTKVADIPILKASHDPNTKQVSLDIKTTMEEMIVNGMPVNIETVKIQGRNHAQLHQLANLGLFELNFINGKVVITPNK